MQAQCLVSSCRACESRDPGHRPPEILRPLLYHLERPEKEGVRFSQLNSPIKEEAVNRTLLPRRGGNGDLFHDTRQLLLEKGGPL